MSTAMSWVKAKATPNLKDAKAETMVARPSVMRYGTHPMWTLVEVNGAATEASAMDSEIPACAVFSAPQSLQPSPHITT